MFTGIVEKVASVLHVDSASAGATQIRLSIETDYEDLVIGESIAVNGACLTVAEYQNSQALFFVSHETLDRTNLGQLRAGSSVNLERALLPQTRLSGHIVQGHVDGMAHVTSREGLSNGAWDFEISVPADLGRYCVEKGSITVNGVSLTINQIRREEEATFLKFTLIPHTWNHTNLSFLELGDAANIELDIIAKYVEQLCKPFRAN